MCDCDVSTDDINEEIEKLAILKDNMNNRIIVGDYIIMFCSFCKKQLEYPYDKIRPCPMCSKNICEKCDEYDNSNEIRWYPIINPDLVEVWIDFEIEKKYLEQFFEHNDNCDDIDDYLKKLDIVKQIINYITCFNPKHCEIDYYGSIVSIVTKGFNLIGVKKIKNFGYELQTFLNQLNGFISYDVCIYNDYELIFSDGIKKIET